jgi:hypothetical protein
VNPSSLPVRLPLIENDHETPAKRSMRPSLLARLPPAITNRRVTSLSAWLPLDEDESAADEDDNVCGEIES